MNTKLNAQQEKSETHISEVLAQIEKAMDRKLSNLKTYIPIVFTLITSVIAYILMINVEKDNASMIKGYMLVLGVLFISFVLMLVSFLGISKHIGKSKGMDIEFSPWRFRSYCALSDEDFSKRLQEYAKRELTDEEILQINMLKLKINEYRFRRGLVVAATIILIAGACFLAIGCFGYAFDIITLK